MLSIPSTPVWNVLQYALLSCPLSQISKIVETLNTQMQTKGRELTEYRERYNIRLVGEGDSDGPGKSAASSKDSEGGGSKGGAGVLVS